MNKTLIIDTSILCVWLGVPRKNTCDRKDDPWDKARVEAVITAEEQRGTTLILPLATLIETGNHIAQAEGKNRYELAQKLIDCLEKAENKESPWAAFSNLLCDKKKLLALAKEWPSLAAQEISIGDAAIKQVAEFYADKGDEVIILTCDKGLKAYQPAAPAQPEWPPIPRRKRKR